MGRQLPTIDFEGTTFTIDLAAKEFRQADEPWNAIPFNDIKRRADERFILEYDTKTKGLYDWVEHLKTGGSLPSHVVSIDVPKERDLDPVGYARFWGMDDENISKSRGPKR